MTSDPVSVSALTAALGDFKDPESGAPVIETQQLQDVQVSGSKASCTLALTTWAAPIADAIQHKLEQEIKRHFPQLTSVTIRRSVHERPAGRLGEMGLTAKTVLAVGSGKGGVGKSTLAASLAIGLKRSGARAGLLDADVYGPSIPHLLGLSQRPEMVQDKIQPVYFEDIAVMSMGFLVPAGEAIVWRGPMLHGAITQMLRDTRWGDLDYLVIDMPPGTGDVALTLSQLIPLTGAVVVCTPQEVALIDAVRAIAMFRKVNIRVLGMVENMSGFLCPDCGRRYDIFGTGGAKRRADELQVPFLGDVPLTMQYRELGDAGKVGMAFRDPQLAGPLEKICQQLVRNLADAAATQAPQLPLPVLE